MLRDRRTLPNARVRRGNIQKSESSIETDSDGQEKSLPQANKHEPRGRFESADDNAAYLNKQGFFQDEEDFQEQQRIEEKL